MEQAWIRTKKISEDEALLVLKKTLNWTEIYSKKTKLDTNLYRKIWQAC